MNAKILFLMFLSFSVLAKTTNPLCINVTGPIFTSGDGSSGNPYLICNKAQFNRLAVEAPLLTNSFKLGTDLDFTGQNLQAIGHNNPFVGNFNGDDYVLNNVNIVTAGAYVGLFGKVQNATISNLTINGMIIQGQVYSKVGGITGYSNGSSLSNLHVNNLKMTAPDYSGGLVGELINSTISLSSAQGNMFNNYGTDASGGLVGYADQSLIFNSAAKVTLSNVNVDPWGVSYIGGLIGSAFSCTINNVYAQSAIDYSNQHSRNMKPYIVGGLIGQMVNTNLQFAYYAGKIQIDADNLGGVAGAYFFSMINTAIPVQNVFWDFELSGVSISAFGAPQTTATMQQSSFWLSNSFNPSIWNIVDGQYPTLIGVL